MKKLGYFFLRLFLNFRNSFFFSLFLLLSLSLGSTPTEAFSFLNPAFESPYTYFPEQNQLKIEAPLFLDQSSKAKSSFDSEVKRIKDEFRSLNLVWRSV